MPKLNSQDLISGERSVGKRIAGIVITADGDQEVMVSDASRTNRRVTKVTFTPDAAITGDNTDFFRLGIVNKGTDGSGSDEVAGLDFVTGVNGVKADAKELTLSATAADLIVLPGEVLEAVKTETASGLAMPAGDVQITFENVGDAIA
jgi:hypothetical protein